MLVENPNLLSAKTDEEVDEENNSELTKKKIFSTTWLK